MLSFHSMVGIQQCTSVETQDPVSQEVSQVESAVRDVCEGVHVHMCQQNVLTVSVIGLCYRTSTGIT